MDTNKERYTFEDFREIIAILRSENGCPWDKEQTHGSLRKNLIEESYEFIHEADINSKEGMCEELGDVLLQILLHSQIAKDNNEFSIDDVIDGISKKMIFRHPHVFGELKAENSEEAYKLFKIKKDKEKKFNNKSDELSHIPEDYPALIKSHKLLSKLHKLQPGVWTNTFEGYMDKIDKEIGEIKEAYANKDQVGMEEELGDVLMAVTALGNAIDIDAEVALSKSFKKMLKRIRIIEEKLLKFDEKIDEISAETFYDYWEKSKKY